MDSTVRLDSTVSRTTHGAAAPEGIRLEVRVGSPGADCRVRATGHVLTRVHAGGAAGGPRPPVNLAIAIDRSGSMEGEPLAQARAACLAAIDLLGPEDVLSIVTFEEQVDVVMPARHVTDKERIRAHVARIAAGNTTNLFDGLYAAGSQAASVPGDGMVHRLLLLTDGEPTAGIKDPTSIAQLAADLRAKGIVVSALGFGPDYNEDLLAAIAAKSGGNYRFLARADTFADVFRDEVLAARRTVARDVRLRLQLPRGVTVRAVQ
ncbi:MAG: vWA domain-containing protein, partial [Armatimonadota bacterium]